jgi:O-antigen ligase
VSSRVAPRLTEPAAVAAGAAAAVAAGAATATGGPGALILLALLGVGALFFAVQRLQFSAVLIWVLGSGVAYPFLRYPSDRALVTFDRVWVLAMTSIVILGAFARRSRRETRLLEMALVLLLAMFGLRAVSTPGQALSATASWVDAVVLPVALYLVVSRLADSTKRCERLAGALALAGVLMSGLGLLERTLGFELASRSGGSARFDEAIGLVRVSGPFSAPEPYALSLLVCFAATLYWLQARGAPALLPGIAAAALQSAAIAMTFFRAAWISAIIIVIAALGLRPRRFARLIAVIGMVGVVLFLAFGRLEENRTFATRVGAEVASDNIAGRLATYAHGLEVFERAPIVGVGVNRYSIAQAELPRTYVDGVGAVTHPHSSFVGMLAEQGVVGFFPLLLACFAGWRLVGSLRRAARSRSDVLLAASLTGAAFAYLLMSATLTMLPYGPSNALFLVLLAMGAARLEAAHREMDATTA